MALATFVLKIELSENGRIYLHAQNNDIPADTVIMRLRAFVNDLEEDYFKDAAASTSLVNPPK